MPSQLPLFGPRHSRWTVLALDGVTSGCLAETSEETNDSHQYEPLIPDGGNPVRFCPLDAAL
jgi:hypothetical protein